MAKPNYERPVEGPTYADAYLDFWGAVYLANPQLAARRVLFSTFLVAPAEILLAVGRTRDAQLLEPQCLVRERLDVAAAIAEDRSARCALELLEGKGARCENGRFVEKLKHRAWPRHAQRRTPQQVE